MLRSAAQSHQTVDGDSEQSKVPPAVGRVNGPRVWAGTMSKDEDEPALRARRKVSGRRPRLCRAAHAHSCSLHHTRAHGPTTAKSIPNHSSYTVAHMCVRNVDNASNSGYDAVLLNSICIFIFSDFIKEPNYKKEISCRIVCCLVKGTITLYSRAVHQFV